MTKQETTNDKEWTNIDYTNTSAYRTVKNWNKIAGVFEVGGETGVTGGIPHDEYAQLKKLRRLDLAVKPDKGPVQKIITHLSRQLVRTLNEKGILVPKECLTVQGEFRGTDWSDMELAMAFTEGWNKNLLWARYIDTSVKDSILKQVPTLVQ